MDRFLNIVTNSWIWANATTRRRRLTRIFLGVALVLVIPALWFAWWLGSPLFIDTVADEEFPRTENATIPETIDREEAEAMMETAAKLTSSMTEPMTPGMMQASVISLKSGSFKDEDRLHRGSGDATLYQLEDDSIVLRLEDLNVTNGPDLRVLLMVDPEGRDKSQGYLELGKLKGNIGNQNYPLPADAEASIYNAVMIYCQPFHVIFSTAALN